ncbi:MAG: (2Fe-2S) ferredoxin domain-containing protein [Lachnospiraceae bacterium]|nr:(2Fe-2S) ferredoxin domain-containing protein [Lachnospiraceae bacterium]
MEKPNKHILVCTSCRLNGVQKGACFSKNAVEIVDSFLTAIEDEGLSDEVMVSNTGCFNMCTQGPIAVVYPDNIWYGHVTPEVAERIVKEHILEGKVVDEFVIEED